jgi:hypothetical protein
VITADSHKTKNFIEYDEGWIKVIVGNTNKKGQQLKLMIHAVRTNTIETANQERALVKL